MADLSAALKGGGSLLKSPVRQQNSSYLSLSPSSSPLPMPPVGLPTLPAIKQQEIPVADGGGRGGRLRFNMGSNNNNNSNISPNRSNRQGGNALLFNGCTSNTGNSIITTLCEGAEAAQRPRVKKESPERRFRDNSTTFQPLLSTNTKNTVSLLSQSHSPVTTGEVGKGGIIGLISDTSSQGTEYSKRGGVVGQQRRENISSEFDPSTYTSLLPATLKLRTAEELKNTIVVGTTASEMLAERGAQYLTGGGRHLSSKKSKNTHSIHPLELRQFETKMKQIQEHGRQQRRRLRRRRPSLTASNTNAIMMVEEGDDNYSESEIDRGSNNASRTSLSKRTNEKIEAVKAAATAKREKINILQIAGNEARDTIVLRNEIKKSKREVEKARYGASSKLLLTLQETTKQQNQNQENYDNKEVKGGWGKESYLSLEENVSWGNENIVHPHQTLPPTISLDNTSTQIMKDRSESRGSYVNITDRSTIEILKSLLHRGKGTLVYGLDPAPLSSTINNNKLQLQQQLHQQALLELQSPLSDCATSIEQISNMKLSTLDKPIKKGVLPVEYGVGEQSRYQLENQIAEIRINELQSGLQHGEDIKRTRQLLLELRPKREKLIDESINHSHENARVILQQHRRQIFQEATSIAFEERQNACFAFLDFLEEIYRDEVAENSWPALSKVLQKSHDLISISPNRCNIKSFQNILKDSLLISHLIEPPVREMLWWIAQLFDMTNIQYKNVMANVYQRLNQPQNYQARFREIERSIIGMSAPVERRLRVTLHRCRLTIPISEISSTVAISPRATGASATNNSISKSAKNNSTSSNNNNNNSVGNINHEGVMEKPEISIQLKTDHQTIISTPVRAILNTDNEIPQANTHHLRGNKSHGISYSANLLDQIFRLQLYENCSINVILLCNGQLTATSELQLTDCRFNARGIAIFWLRASSKGGSIQADIKFSLELLGDKEKKRNMPARMSMQEVAITSNKKCTK